MRKRNGKLLKRIVAVLLSAVLLTGMAQGAAPVSVLAAGAGARVALPISGTDWTLDADGKLTIVSDAGMADWVANKDTYEDIRKEQLKTVEIQNGVKSIGEEAFWICGELTEITIPESVNSIGTKAFQGCKNLQEVTVPSGVERIEDSVFYSCDNIKKIVLPDGLKSIASNAFCFCWSLPELKIPSGVTSIGSGAFFDCRSLPEITIPSGITSIEEGVFYECKSLTEVRIPENVTSIGEMAFFECTGLQKITIPEGVGSIGEEAFGRCSSLTEITIPENVTSIAERVFYGCTNLVKIVISEDVDSIGAGAFDECRSLPAFTIPENVTSIEESTFSGCISLMEVIIPSGVTNIGMSAFQECASLKEIAIPSGVTDIGVAAFYGCSSLEKITIPEGVKSLEGMLFAECSSLPEITIPQGVTKIGEMAFYGCNGLTEITIPSGVTDIDTGAFYACGSLAKVSMKGTTPPALGEAPDMAFTDCYFVTENLEGIEVPKDSLNAYKGAWTDWAEYIIAAAVPADSVPPTGTIKIESHSWSSFLNTITFGMFFQETKSVTIEALDEDSGVAQVCYYISDNALSELEVKALGADVWTEGDAFSINPDRKCVIYAKLTDNAGNTAYLSSEGLVFDGTAPLISGVTDGETYLTPQVVTVTDDNLESVKVNGREVVLSGHKFTLEAASGQQTIVAADKAGNTATVTVTVKTGAENETVDKEVVTDGKAPATQISTPVEKLTQILLTEEEKQQMAEGIDIKIILDVKDVSDSVSSGDKTLVENALKNTAGHAPQYLDISLFKVIGGSSRSAISETKEAIIITIKVPDNLKNTDSSKTRTFSVIRVHGGVVETLKDLDNDADTITIATDRFSTYAITYQEAGSSENTRPTRVPDVVIKPTETPGVDARPTQAPGEDVKPTETPDGTIKPTEAPGEDVKPTETPGEDIKPTETPGGDVGPTETPDDEKKKASDKEKRKIEIHSGLKAVRTEKNIQISWGSVKGADGYEVYVQNCGKGFGKPLSQVKGGGKTKITVKEVNGRKLDTKKNYKMYVAAYKWQDGKKSIIAKTLTVHIAGKDSVKYTNVKNIQLKKTSYTLKKGDTVTLRPKAVLYDRRKKQLPATHDKEFRYLSSNQKVAAVTAGGKIKAKGTGSCTIYVFAKNGCRRKVKITVKNSF